MDEHTRRQITWVLIIAVILSVIVVASYRRAEMQRLCDVIADGTPQQRIAAVETLVHKQKLQEALEDRPRWVQDQALAAIPLINTHEAYYELLTCHGVFDAPVQTRDQNALTRLAGVGVELFVEAIQDKDATTRGTGKGPLTNIGKTMSADAKAKANNPVVKSCLELLDAWDGYVRDNVRDILAAIPTPEVTTKLIPVMQQKEPTKRSKQLPDGKLRDQTTQEFMRAKATAEATLVLMKVPALDPIIANLVASPDPEVRGAACRILGAISNQTTANIPAADAVKVVAPLLKRLSTDGQWGVRRRAATALGFLADVAKQNAVVPALIGHLSDYLEVKAACAEALGRIGDASAIVPLVNTLTTNRAGATKELRIALVAMGWKAIPEITRALKHPETEVRFLATQALAQLGGPNAVVPLGTMLKDADPPTRRVAADALRGIADTRVLTQVAAALSDSDWQVYHAARDALANVGSPAVPVLVAALGDANPRVASMAMQALARIGMDAVPALRAALSSPSETQAHWAAIALGSVGFDAVKPAIQSLQNLSLSAQARAEAAVALGRMGAGDAVVPLVTALGRQEPQVKVQAVYYLERLSNELATPGLAKALNDPSPEVRDAAMDVLRNWRIGKVIGELQSVAKTGDVNAKRRATLLLAEQTSVASHELLAQVSDITASQAGQVQIDLTTLEAAAKDPREAANVRERSIAALGFAGTESNLKALTGLLKPSDPFAGPAAIAVARIGSKGKTEAEPGQRPTLSNAAKTLIDLMLTTDDEDLRFKVAAGVALMGEQPAWTLIERLDPENKTPERLKPLIVAALGAIGKDATNAVLEVRGETSKADYKRWLAVALTLIGDAQAGELLKHLSPSDQPKPEQLKPSEALLAKIRLAAI